MLPRPRRRGRGRQQRHAALVESCASVGGLRGGDDGGGWRNGTARSNVAPSPPSSIWPCPLPSAALSPMARSPRGSPGVDGRDATGVKVVPCRSCCTQKLSRRSLLRSAGGGRDCDLVPVRQLGFGSRCFCSRATLATLVTLAPKVSGSEPSKADSQLPLSCPFRVLRIFPSRWRGWCHDTSPCES
jgi:hypothetical protein